MCQRAMYLLHTRWYKYVIIIYSAFLLLLPSLMLPLASADVFPYRFSFDSISQLNIVYYLSWHLLCMYREWNTRNLPPCQVPSECCMWNSPVLLFDSLTIHSLQDLKGLQDYHKITVEVPVLLHHGI